MKLFEAMLQSSKGAMLFLGESGIGKTELLKHLVSLPRNLREYNVACAYVEAWPSMLATDPFIDSLAFALDSIASLESTTERARDQLKKIGGALAHEANTMTAAILTDILQKVVGKETVEAIRQIFGKYLDMKSEIEAARNQLVSQPRSFIYVVNTILAAIHRTNPNLKVVLVFDQFERVAEMAWWILLDLMRASQEQVYVLTAFRQQAESTSSAFERFLLEAQHLQNVQTHEMRGLEIEEIREWIQRARGINLPIPQLSRIRQNSGGFPIVLGPWVRRSEALDPDELKSPDLRRAVCDDVQRRIGNPPLDLALTRFLHQLAVLDAPLPLEAEPKSYCILTQLDSVTVGYYADLLAKRLVLDGNVQRPWFRHELVKACIEDRLQEIERRELHERAAQFYEGLDEAKNSGRQISFAVSVGCAFHFHEAQEYEKSYTCNYSLARLARSMGELDVADRSFRRAVKDAELLGDENRAMAAKGDWAEVLQTWGKIDEAKAIYEDELGFFLRHNFERGQAIALSGLAGIARSQSQYDEAERLSKLALDISRRLRDQWGTSANLHGLGIIAALRGNYNDARLLFEQSLEIVRAIGDTKNVSRSLHQLAEVTAHLGKPDEAERFYEESMEIAQKLGDQQVIASNLHELSILAQLRGDQEQARRLCEQSLQVNERLGDMHAVASSLHHLSILLESQNCHEEAERHCRESLEILQRLGDQAGIAASFQQLGIIAGHRGDYDDAESMYRKSLEIHESLRDQAGVSANLNQLGMISALRGRYDEAESLLSKSLEISETLADERGTAVTLAQIGSLARVRGQLDRAEGDLSKALEIASRIMDKNTQENALRELDLIRRIKQVSGHTIDREET